MAGWVFERVEELVERVKGAAEQAPSPDCHKCSTAMWCYLGNYCWLADIVG